MKIIAFGHRKRAGKDTSAKYVKTQLRAMYPDKKIIHVGFASKVKDVAHQIFGWAGLRSEKYYNNHPEEIEVVLPQLGKTPRQLWIGVGNGVRAATGYDDVWLDYVLHSYDCDVLINSDLRFPAEAEGMLKLGGLLYRVDCPWAPVVTDGADDRLAHFDKWTGVIKNDKKHDFGRLYDQLGVIIREHF